MKSAWAWFLAKMVVLPSRSLPATFCPRVIKCSNTLGDMEEFAHCRQRVKLLDGAMTMHGRIAQAIDKHRLGKDGSAGRGLESRLVDERAQVVLVRQPQCRIVLVKPMHHHLQ